MATLPEYISFLKENRTRDQATEIYDQRIIDSIEIFEKFSDEFFYRDCPVCGDPHYENLDKFNGQYGVVRCSKCASLFVNPTPSLKALDYYYNHCECNKQLGKLLKTRVGKRGVILSERSVFVLKLIDQLLSAKNEIRVLEVGSNSGTFLHELSECLTETGKADSVSLVGIDIDKSAIESPVSDRITLYHASAEDFVARSEQSFDLILHFELIEHLHDPFGFCCALNRLLCPGGLMYFHTPNALGLDNQALSYNAFRPLAHGIFPPMHLNAFTTQNVAHFMMRTGFKIKAIETPGNFDVDIVRQFNTSESPLSIITEIKDEQSLAILQFVIRSLGASSHLAVCAEK